MSDKKPHTPPKSDEKEIDVAALSAGVMRWSRLVGQFGGWVKLGSDCYQAANFFVPVAQYASSGVRPASAECGRRAL